ncbi:hypothetical protein [Arthrobacter sp. H35-D1]|uniref:hypothetical protein n=1 Tax=Arthrobacter sp. H35-D1 TaxID=3046202 RepID=UPI0024B8868A|nr:hypothetical protein [Arthrobacter sp. H35-D1]MDJ0311841.1 hypothetical protein [Arthrobacter sp. H35-D1]
MTEQHTPSAQSAAGNSGTTPSHAAVGPLTIRDLWVLGSVAIIFVASLVPLISNLAGSFNLWNTGGLFYIGIGVVLPLAVGGLFLARRLSPESKVRFGSLSVDQFASVVAAFATFFFFTGAVTSFGPAYLVGLVGSLLLLAGTVCAQWIPFLASDFSGRAEVPAHVAARDAIPAPKRAVAAKPAAVAAGAGAAGTHYGHGAPRQGAQATPAQGNQGMANQGQGNQGQSNQGQGGAQAAGGWAAAPAAGHSSAGQIFTPAKEGNPAQGAPAQSGATQASTATGASAGAKQAGAIQTGAGHAGAGGAAAQTAAAKATASTSAATESAAAAQPAAEQSASHGSAAGKSGVETSSNETATAASAGGADRFGSDRSGSDRSDGGQPGAAQGAAAATTLNPQVAAAAKDSIAATVNPKAAAAPVSVDPFWFAVDRPQNVIDENTRQFLFKLAPGAWILALEDRGNSFLVQDSHGKTGVLLDLVGIERASDSQ